MANQREKPSSGAVKRQSWVTWVVFLLLLVATAWCARYWLSPYFGLYEDDLTFIPAAIEMDFDGILSTISGYFSTLAEQGRPFMWSWVVLFGHLGWHLGGLQGMYGIAFVIWMANITLFVALLRRVHPDLLFCVIGGLAYVVFSADTNQAFLFNAFGLQTALTFLLISFHFYLNIPKWRWLAYLFLVLVMFNYETPFGLFLAAPLLTQAEDQALKMKLWVNTLLMALIFFSIYILRLLAGESRVAGLGFPEMITTPIKHMVIGPVVGLGAYFLRPLQVLGNITTGLGLAAVLGSGIFFALLSWVEPHQQRTDTALFPLRKGWWTDLSQKARREIRLALAGIMMLVLAYSLTVILRPYAISGRATRVHLAAVVGAALILGSVSTLIYRSLKRRNFRMFFLLAISLVLGLNFAFGFTIQKDYQRSWELEKQFWQDLLPLIQDVRDGTAVLVEPGGLEDPLFINANTWNLPRILPQLYEFPPNWEKHPQVFRLVGGWEDNIVRIPGYFTLDGSNVYANMRVFGDFAQKNTIFISNDKGEFMRLFEFDLNGEILILKPAGKSNLEGLKTKPLYDLLIED